MFSTSISKCFLAFFLLLVLLVCSGFQREFVDDTLITFVYARNLVEYGFPYWHPDLPPVDGFTSVGHMLALAGLHATGLGLVAANSILIFGAGALIIWLYLSAVRGLSLPAQIGGGLIIVLNSSLGILTAAGLDGVPYAAAFFASYLALERAIALDRFTPSLALALCALALMRPEGQIIGLGILGFWIALRGLRRVGTGGLGWLAVTCAFILGIFALRVLIYGHPLPNTFYAKSGDRLAELEAGIYYLWGWFVTGAGVLTLAIPLGVARGSGGWLRLLFLLGNTALVAVAGGDSHLAFRFILPVLPLIAIDVAWLLSQIKGRQTVAVLLLVPVYLALQSHSQLPGRAPVAELKDSLAAIGNGAWPMREIAHSPVAAERVSAAMDISALFPADIPIAASDVGAFAFGVKQPVIDLLGLNHPQLEHLPKPADHNIRWGVPRVAEVAAQGTEVFNLWFPYHYDWSFPGVLSGEHRCTGDAVLISAFLSHARDILVESYVLVSVQGRLNPDRWLNLVVHEDAMEYLNAAETRVLHDRRLLQFIDRCRPAGGTQAG